MSTSSPAASLVAGLGSSHVLMGAAIVAETVAAVVETVATA